jgi:hypothetical protein
VLVTFYHSCLCSRSETLWSVPESLPILFKFAIHYGQHDQSVFGLHCNKLAIQQYSFIVSIYIHAQINTVGGVVCRSSSTHMCNMRPIVLTIYFTQVGSEFTRAHKFNKAPGLQFLDIPNVLWVTDLTNIIWVQRDSVTHVPGSCFWWWRHITCNPLLRQGGRKLWNYAGRRKSLKHNMQRMNGWMYVCSLCMVWSVNLVEWG